MPLNRILSLYCAYLLNCRLKEYVVLTSGFFYFTRLSSNLFPPSPSILSITALALLHLSCTTSLSSWSECTRRRRGRWRRSGETSRRRWTPSTGRRWQPRRSPYLSPSRKTRTRKSKQLVSCLLSAAGGWFNSLLLFPELILLSFYSVSSLLLLFFLLSHSVWSLWAGGSHCAVTWISLQLNVPGGCLQHTSISAIILRAWHVLRKLPPLFVLPKLNISCPFTRSFCLALIIQDIQGGATELGRWGNRKLGS